MENSIWFPNGETLFLLSNKDVMKRLIRTPSFMAIASGRIQSGCPPKSVMDTFIDEINTLVTNETNYEATLHPFSIDALARGVLH